MTTNHIDHLDEALIRSGRVDLKLFVGYPNESQTKRMFLKFFPEELHLAEDFANAVMELQKKTTVSMADLQGHLLKNRRDAAKAYQTVGILGSTLAK